MPKDVVDDVLEKVPPKQQVTISPPNFKNAKITIVGTAPYVMNKFSSINRQQMMETQMEGSTSKKGKKRKPKDFDAVYRGAMHISSEGWYGIPASSFRNAMISACRVTGFFMARAKLGVFIIGDGFDKDDGQPLIKLNGKPVRRDMAVRLATGSTDIVSRPFFEKWSADVTVRWDGDMFTATDIMNLMHRVGIQVGIGAGRPDSKTSTGMGWGTFEIKS